MGRPMTQIRLKYVHEYRRKNGSLVRYVRRPGMQKVRLPGLPGSPEFMEAYQSALSGGAMPKGHGFKSGSVGVLVERFYRSVEFTNLVPSSQATYRLVLSQFVEKDGHRMVADMPDDKARKIIEEIGITRPGMANLTRSILARLFNFAIDCHMRKDNPFARVPIYNLGSRHTWTDEQLTKYERRWAIGTRERLAYMVLLYTAQRVSDAVRLKRGPVLTFTQKKTGTELTLPIHPALDRAIKAGPSNGIYLIGGKSGRPMTSTALTRFMRRAIDKAGLPTECVAHGLRKAALRRLAESSASSKGIAAISGHRTLREVERYTAKADQARLAATAMALLPDDEG